MSTITINGKFTTKSKNQSVTTEIYAPNSTGSKYDFKKTYTDDFVLKLTDLLPNTIYFIDLTGYTFGGVFTFTLNGDFSGTNPITDTFTNTDFAPGYTITTNPVQSLI